MKKTLIPLFFIFLQTLAFSQNWKGKWISTQQSQSITNTWLMYRKQVDLHAKPAVAKARIAADSKYWLWINEKLIVFEGGLKRGPNPEDTYFDELDIAPFLSKGVNTIAVLTWYFGKDGFSHKSSGRAGMIFNCEGDGFEILSDKSWKCGVAKMYKTAGLPLPNFRLSESSILYDAREEGGFWQGMNYDDARMAPAMELGVAGDYPWNKLVQRPIPLWKDYGLKKYPEQSNLSAISIGDTIVCKLPYNAQITPYFKIDAKEGEKIIVFTDNYHKYNGGEPNLRAEYITKEGIQEYENPGWMNGHQVLYLFPKGVKILELKFRETGYDTDFTGAFECSDPFFKALWEKAKRTLYVTMRDNYMDCPERERAQWTGDAVIESGEAFYALSPSSHPLTKKWLYEILNWHKSDGSLYSPVPSGNWQSELPDQVLATLGVYGIWNYYLHTGDKQTLSDLYPKARKYLDLWEADGKGTMKFRAGDWTWGDWGDNRDLLLIYNLWYYLAAQGMLNAAVELGMQEDAKRYSTFMKEFKQSFNSQFWNGKAYRDPAYKGKTDDRVQALAVVSGIADEGKYKSILSVFETEMHASPYMEKYVFEAMFRMGRGAEALGRHKKRFKSMVENDYFTTLFEGWGIGKEGFGGGTVNHAWSGGGLTVLSQYLCGVAPIEPGYKLFQILPQPSGITGASLKASCVKGEIKSSFERKPGGFVLIAGVPEAAEAVIGLPGNNYSKILLNGQAVWEKGKYLKKTEFFKSVEDGDKTHVKFKVGSGNWKLEGAFQ